MGKKMGRIQRVHDLYEPNFAHLNGGMCQIYLSLKSKMAEAPILNFQKNVNIFELDEDTVRYWFTQWRNDELFSWWKFYIRNWKHLKATRTAVVWMTGWEVEEYLSKSGLTFTIRRGPKCTLRTADEFSCQFFDDDVIEYALIDMAMMADSNNIQRNWVTLWCSRASIHNAIDLHVVVAHGASDLDQRRLRTRSFAQGYAF